MNYKRLFVENGIIFITFVTSKRRNILIENVDILRNSFIKTKKNFVFEIIAICILPNHVHMIIKPKNIKEYPLIVKAIKSDFSKNIDISTIKDYKISESKKQKNEKDIWQRRYYEHTIRDIDDLNKHIDYIHYNSTKHLKIAPKNWKYSSFRKFVKNGFYEESWCNLEDKNNITKMNLE